jgi:hypothetical protein
MFNLPSFCTVAIFFEEPPNFGLSMGCIDLVLTKMNFAVDVRYGPSDIKMNRILLSVLEDEIILCLSWKQVIRTTASVVLIFYLGNFVVSDTIPISANSSFT